MWQFYTRQSQLPAMGASDAAVAGQRMTNEDGGDLVEDVDGLLRGRALVDGFLAGHCLHVRVGEAWRCDGRCEVRRRGGG